MKVIVSMIYLFFIILGFAAAHEKPGFTIYFLHVGQADCMILRTFDNKTMLIDAGDRGDQAFIIDYLHHLGIKKLDIVLATHPHHDHIGGMGSVIRQFQVDAFYMPDLIHHTQAFLNLLKEAKKQQLMIQEVKEGMIFQLGSAVKIECLTPLRKKFNVLNDYSVVTKISHLNHHFLLMADVGVDVEKELIKKHKDLSADVIKIGHHGANTSTSEKFLQAVRPKVAILTSENRQVNGYPSFHVLKRLNEHGVLTLRTDEWGTLIVGSYANDLEILSNRYQIPPSIRKL